MRSYSELVTLPTFEERFRYLKLDGEVGKETFGFDRYLNQQFYHSEEWKQVRNEVIVRDAGCDLAIPDREIFGRVFIHHMNPICMSDIDGNEKYILDPEYLITVSKKTHDAIHYGDGSLLMESEPIVRTAGDTCPWR